MRRKRNQTDFQAEIQAHVQLEADQLQANGLNPKEAEMAARRAFGNRGAAEERFYEAGRCLWWDHPVRDLRFAARMMAKDRRFSVLATLGVALGIGISTRIFTMINAALQARQVMQHPKSYVGITRAVDGRIMGDFSYAEYGFLRDRTMTFRMLRRNGPAPLPFDTGLRRRGTGGAGTIRVGESGGGRASRRRSAGVFPLPRSKWADRRLDCSITIPGSAALAPIPGCWAGRSH